MFQYVKQYNWQDMKQVITNGKAPQKTCSESMEGKLCVVTGATSGVGLEAVRVLHRFGADIVMINRNRERSEGVVDELVRTGAHEGIKTGSVDYLLGDFSDLVQIRDIIENLKKISRPIDVLINNAGIHMTRRVLTPQGMESVFVVNHLSSFMITRAFIPIMQKQKSGRIIQVNSQGHRFFGLNLSDLDWKKRPYIGLRAYGAAKTAQLLCCWEFADQLAGTNITINAMHPGAVKTNVGNNNGWLYRWYFRNFVWKNLDDVAVSGAALHYLAASPELNGANGKYFNLTHEEKPAPHGLDRELGRRIWEKSCELSEA